MNYDVPQHKLHCSFRTHIHAKTSHAENKVIFQRQNIANLLTFIQLKVFKIIYILKKESSLQIKYYV